MPAVPSVALTECEDVRRLDPPFPLIFPLSAHNGIHADGGGLGTGAHLLHDHCALHTHRASPWCA